MIKLLKRNFVFKIITAFVFLLGVSETMAQMEPDTLNLPYKVAPEPENPFVQEPPSSNINLKDPSNVSTEVEYDLETGQYIIRKKVGNVDYAVPYNMSFEDYQNYSTEKNLNNYWRQRYKSETFEHQSSLIPKINVGSEAFETIFGSSTIDIRPQGSASLRFGVKINSNDDPTRPEELRRNTTFDFKEEIQMNVTGKIGDNLEMKVSYNTESQFEFDNTMNLRYQGKEDDIIQKIEAGNVSLPLTTSLISGSQSLFGILSELKFGNLYVTSVFSQQEGETKTINVEGGAQKTEYDISAVEYDKNRHFFLAHYFRQNYDEFLSALPSVNTPVNITKVEVWVTNTTRNVDNARNIVAMMDLGEQTHEYTLYGKTVKAINDEDLAVGTMQYPSNEANNLYSDLTGTGAGIRNINQVAQTLSNFGYRGGRDYEKVEYARKLDPSDYTLNAKLGYISLNSALNADEVLAVAFEYSVGGEVFQVGEFSTDGFEGNETMVVKLLKGTSFIPRYPNWDLMMKNIYAIGAYQVNRDDFVLEIEYYDDETGTRLFNLPDQQLNDSVRKEKLLRIMNLDNLNSQQNYVENGDGVFDFVNNVTIRSSNGRVIFPIVEPFGGYLRQKIDNEQLAKKYIYQALYDSTQYKAEQITSKNKYYLSGYYKSEGGSEIYLNSFNIPQGSVKVTAGGIVLQENIDYTVDYNMGRVKIINESYLASGTPIKISLESNSMFSIQSKTLMGTHLDYRFNPDFNLGATVMNLTERPLTQKVNMGEEPISNTIWGLNGSYRTDVPFLTRAIDFLPLIETKEMSSITLEGEFAQLVPGHNKAIGKSGNAFIDDFEGSESSIDLKSKTGWVLASIPQDKRLFPESDFQYYNTLISGYNRAKLAWYQIDPIFFRAGSPVSADVQSSLKVYRVDEQDIFPDKEQPNNQPTEISTLDLAYYPQERGPYNYDTEGEPGISSGLNEEGLLSSPEERWAGIMRELTTNDFEATNVEYIMFWMMDPFVEDDTVHNGGELYFNLGNVSEDILRDGRKSYEHGLATDGDQSKFDITAWGRVPAIQASNQGFVNDAALRPLQDIGLDGLGSSLPDDIVEGLSQEQAFFADYLNALETIVTNPAALQEFQQDPSNDDYHYFRGGGFDEDLSILERYKNFNNHEGNTPVSEDSPETYSTVGQRNPDVEDINGDFTLGENENYFQYRLNLDPNNMAIGRNFITDIKRAKVNFENGENTDVDWYQFKIPISAFDDRIGTIQDFKSIRFMRMFLKGWEESIVLRFAKLELVRSEWRKYDYIIKESDESLVEQEEFDPTQTPFSIAAVNIEENGSRAPVNYVLPPGVDRQQDPSNQQLRRLNEQSMAMKVDSLEDGYSKAVYKTINMDMRDYGKLEMYIHAESRTELNTIEDDDVTCFVRLGSDFTDNYYEYEVPLKVTEPWLGKPYDKYSEEDRYAVWPEENNMIIEFEELVSAKLKRNDLRRQANSGIDFTSVYTHIDKYGRRIIVKGNPNLANVKMVMIGIRNPSQKYNYLNGDDGQPKSAEVWVNELRLSDFDENGGWAATGRMTARLADFGTISVAGSTTQPGFGSIEQSGQERAKEETNQIDVATNLELGKFFPKEANVRIPMYLGYSRTAINPEYNPLDQDVKLERTLKNPNLSESEKEDILDKAQDLTERKSINFTNVGIGRSGKGKTKFYSPSNLSTTYAYSELTFHNVNTKEHLTKTHMGSLNYTFNNQPKNVQPFKKSKLLKKPALRLIGDFNFYYAPSQVAFRTTVNRKYSETLLRNLNNPAQVYKPTYDKNFTWNRQFNVKYNFSKSLKFDFATNTRALIEEPDGLVDRSDERLYEEFKDSVWNSIADFGSPDTYNQKFNASYNIPINKIPLLNWISANARYSSMYDWTRAPRVQSDDQFVGHNIKNSQKVTLNGQFNMDNLYNKAGFLDKINKKYKQSREQRNKPKFETVEYTKDKVRLTAKKPKRIPHNLGTEEEIKVEVKSENGKPVRSSFEIVTENRIEVEVDKDMDKATVIVTGKKQVKNNPIIVGLEQTARMLMGFKQISVSGSSTNGSILGGYKEEHDFTQLPTDPGLPFIFGIQDTAFAQRVAENYNLIDNQNLISPYAMTSNLNLSAKATYQPFRDLRIDFAGQRNITSKFSEYYYPTDEVVNGKLKVDRADRSTAGSYSMNIWMINTAFIDKPTKTDQSSETFQQYRDNLLIMAWRLADERAQFNPGFEDYVWGNYNPEFDGRDRDTMPFGYTTANPDVAIPAFLAAYTGADAKSAKMNFLSTWAYLRPTWRVKFDGLKNIKPIEKYFRNITISHGYNSTFSIGSYSSNVGYNYDQAKDDGLGNMSWATGKVNDSLFVSQYDISTFSATEQFVPLFSIDMTWKNNVLSKFEYKKTRTITMSLVNNMMTELHNWEYTVGSGYRFDDLRINVNGKEIVSDLNIRGDVSIRDNITINRNMAENFNEITAGQKSLTIKLSADYQVSNKLQVRAYFDHLMNDPKVTTTYRNTQTEFGFEIRFSLAQ